MQFYTSVERRGKNLLVRGIDEDGCDVKKKVAYKPTLYVPCEKTSVFKTIHEQYVAPLDFDSMRDASDYIKDFGHVSGVEVFGSTNYPCTFINEEYPGEITPDLSKLRVGAFDIEVSMEGAMPNIDRAQQPITSISLIRFGGIRYVFGLKDYEPVGEEIYIHCVNEKDLLNRFIMKWTEMDLHVISGWNIDFFDIPYLIHRIEKVFNEIGFIEKEFKYASKLSPWGYIDVPHRTSPGRPEYKIAGITSFDYYKLYQKFSPTKKESYKLDFIAHLELGKKKLDYSEYKTLTNLYEQNHQKYIEYNLIDSLLIEQFEDKLKKMKIQR